MHTLPLAEAHIEEVDGEWKIKICDPLNELNFTLCRLDEVTPSSRREAFTLASEIICQLEDVYVEKEYNKLCQEIPSLPPWGRSSYAMARDGVLQLRN